MQTVTKKLIVESPPSKPATGKAPEFASASVPDTLAALHVNPETGLMHTEVDIRRKEHDDGPLQLAKIARHLGKKVRDSEADPGMHRVDVVSFNSRFCRR
jgi:hypothetical protein